MISLHRRRFLFGAVPALVVARTYFLMPKLDLAPAPKARTQVAWGDSLWRMESGYNDWHWPLNGRLGTVWTSNRYVDWRTPGVAQARFDPKMLPVPRTETAIAAFLTA